MCKHSRMGLRSAIYVCLCLLAIGAHAEDLGTIGPTYDIAEKDLIEVMKDKYRRMEKSGELARLHEDYKNKVIGDREAKTGAGHKIHRSRPDILH